MLQELPLLDTIVTKRSNSLYIPTMDTSDSRIDLKSIIQVDKIEHILSSLMAKLDDQEKTIQQLQKSSNSFTVQGEMSKTITALEMKVQELTQKLESVETASTVKLGNNLK